MKLILLIIFLFPALNLAQIEQDTIYDLNDLPEFNEEILEDEIHNVIKKGWFITPVKTYFTYGVTAPLQIALLESANNITSEGFSNSELVSNKIKLTRNQREISLRNKKGKKDDYPLRGFYEIGLISKLSIKDFVNFRFEFTYLSVNSLLMNSDRDKNFLHTDNQLYDLKEAFIIENKDYGINSKIGIQMPIWGAISKTGDQIIESVYFLYAGYTNTQILHNDFNDFYQLANHNGKIRYKNGKDTIGIGNFNTLKTLNKSRNYIDFGIGFNYEAIVQNMHFGYAVELSYSYALDDVITDDRWKQDFIKFHYQIYIDGIIKELIK